MTVRPGSCPRAWLAALPHGSCLGSGARTPGCTQELQTPARARPGPKLSVPRTSCGHAPRGEAMRQTCLVTAETTLQLLASVFCWRHLTESCRQDGAWRGPSGGRAVLEVGEGEEAEDTSLKMAVPWRPRQMASGVWLMAGRREPESCYLGFGSAWA